MALRVFDTVAANPVTLIGRLLVRLRASFDGPSVVSVHIVHMDVQADRRLTELLWRHERGWAANHDNGFAELYFGVADPAIWSCRAHPFSEAENTGEVIQCCPAVPIGDVGADRRVVPTFVMSHCHPPGFCL